MLGDGKIRRVLVVGFELHMVQLAERIFNRKGATVATSDDLHAAIEQVCQEVPDLIAVDGRHVPGSELEISNAILEACPEASRCQLVVILGKGNGANGPLDPTAFANVANNGRELVQIRAGIA